MGLVTRVCQTFDREPNTTAAFEQRGEVQRTTPSTACSTLAPRGKGECFDRIEDTLGNDSDEPIFGFKDLVVILSDMNLASKYHLLRNGAHPIATNGTETAALRTTVLDTRA